MEAEAVLYFITGIVILTFIAFCYACYCTCRQMKLTTSSPSSSTSSRTFWSGNSNTVMTLYPARLRRQATDHFRQMSWKTFMQRRNRSPTAAAPLIANSRTPSFSDPRPLSSRITVFCERRNSPEGLPTYTVTTLGVPGSEHTAISLPINCLQLQHPNSDASFQIPPDLPPPSYDDALRLSTLVPNSTPETQKTNENQQCTNINVD